jgi:hypothetical protein
MEGNARGVVDEVEGIRNRNQPLAPGDSPVYGHWRENQRADASGGGDGTGWGAPARLPARYRPRTGLA